jgi:hypothetical protein
MDGQCLHWSAAGTLVGKYTMRNGTGRMRIFHENLTVKSSDGYVDNLRSGLHLEVHENGQLRGVGTYDCDKLIGKGFAFWDNGDPKIFCNYSAQGSLHGTFIMFRSQGTRDISYFLNGQEVLEAVFVEAMKTDKDLIYIGSATQGSRAELSLPDEYRNFIMSERHKVLGDD